MSAVNNVPRDVQESIRESLGRRVKLYIKRMVKYEARPEKWENRVLAFSGCRIHVFTAKAPTRQECSLKYLDIQSIDSKKSNQLSLVVEGKQYNFAALEPDTDEINHMIIHIGSSIKQLFPAFPLGRLIKNIEVEPADRLKPMYDMMKNIESKEPGPCGGFTLMYACMCDYHNVPYREEVAWDVDTIYLSQDSRELRLQDFDHLNPKDLLPIIAALEHNPWFTRLDAENVKLSNEAQNEVLKVMMRNAVIEELSLSNTGITGEFVQKLATALLSNAGTQLTKIDLSNNLIEDKAITFFIGSLGNLTKGLVHFDISRTKITAKGINKVAETLAQNSVVTNTLKILKLADNVTRGEDLPQLNQFLAQPNAISHLDLSGTECALEHLCPALLRGCCPSLTHLSLARNVFSYKKTKEVIVQPSLKSFFATVVGLEYLDLSGCKIPPEALKELLLGIGSNMHIKKLHLDLSSNDLQSQGAVHLESCIANISNVTSLDISNNGLDQGLISMLDWIQKNNTLKHLAIGRNFNQVKPKLMPNVLDSVVKVIQDEDLSLESLSLADSKLRRDVTVVINALGSNATLTHLDISGNQMGDFGARMLSKALQINSKLRSIIWDKNLTTAQGFEDIADALIKNYTLRKMPTPVNDAAQALLKQPERTETALEKIEVLLQRNHSPQKYSSDQAYRLQQGFLISSTQQMVDRLVVQVQDTTNALSIGSTEGIQPDIDKANRVIKDADNSKQLLPGLQDIAIKSVSEGNPVEQRLQKISKDLTEVLQAQMKKTVTEMVETTKRQCACVLADETSLSELESSCYEKSALPKDFTKNVLDGIETEIFNKLNELNLAVAAHISDRVVDAVLDSLSTSHKTLTNHLNIKKSKQKNELSPPLTPTTKPPEVIEDLEPEKKKKTDIEENEKPKSTDTNLLQPDPSPVSSPWVSFYIDSESSTPNIRDQRKSRRIRPPTVIDAEHVQKALQLHNDKTSPANSPASTKNELHPQSQPVPKPRVRHSRLMEQGQGHDHGVTIKIDDVSSPRTVTPESKPVSSQEDLTVLNEDSEVARSPSPVSKPERKPPPEAIEIDTLPELQVQKLNHVGKDRPKRLKTNRPRRPVTKQNDVISNDDQLVADEGMDLFYNTPAVVKQVAVPSTKEGRKESMKETTPPKKDLQPEKPSKPEAEKPSSDSKSKKWSPFTKDKDQSKEKDKKSGIANFLFGGKKGAEKNSSPDRAAKNRKSPERSTKRGKSPEKELDVEKTPDINKNAEVRKETSSKPEASSKLEASSKPVKREESVKSQKSSDEEVTQGEPPKESKSEPVPEPEVKKPGGHPKIALMPKKAGFGGNLLAEMKVKQENRVSKMLLDEKSPANEQKKKTENLDNKEKKEEKQDDKAKKEKKEEKQDDKAKTVKEEEKQDVKAKTVKEEEKQDDKAKTEKKEEKEDDKAKTEKKEEKQDDKAKKDEKNKKEDKEKTVEKEIKEEKEKAEDEGNKDEATDSPLRPPRPKSQAAKTSEDTESHRHSILKMVQQPNLKPKPAPRASGTPQRNPSQSSTDGTVESQSLRISGDGKPRPQPPVKPRPPVTAPKPGRSSFNKPSGDELPSPDNSSEVKENGSEKGNGEVVVDSATLRLNVRDKIKKLAGDVNMNNNNEHPPPFGFRKKNTSLPRDSAGPSEIEDRSSRPHSMFAGNTASSDMTPIVPKLPKTKSDVNLASSVTAEEQVSSENKDSCETKDSGAKGEKVAETTKDNSDKSEESRIDSKADEIIMV